MPYEFYGKTTLQHGKTLWEILGNLKNHGVGRIIVRNQFQRYREPSWYRILKVEGIEPEGKIEVVPPVLELGELRRVRALVDKVFCGTYRGQEWIAWTSYKPDFRLIPKDEEESFTKVKKGALPQLYEQEEIMPTHSRFPPLLRELLIQDMKAKGTYNGQEPMLPLVYNNPKRHPKDGEIAKEVSPSLGKPVCPRLYNNIKKS